MKRTAIALGILGLLLVVLIGVGLSQGGAGFFMSPNCATVPNPATGSTLCWQTSAPNSFVYWNGAGWVPPVLGDPYTPTTLPLNGVLYGNDTGPILATAQGGANTVLVANAGPPAFSAFPLVSRLTSNSQFGVGLNPFGTSAGNTGQLFFAELAANGTNTVSVKGPDTIAADIAFVLPSIVGVSGQCLGTDGTALIATLSWVACSPGAGSGITTLNALTAVTQTFANDTNVTMTSVTSTHTLGWTGTLAVSRGGLGVGTLASNGVLIGNGTSAVVVSAAGAADTMFRVPGAGGTPAFGALDVSKAAAITGLVRTANLGSGSADATVFLRGDQTWAAGFGVPTYNFVFNSDMEVWGAGTSALPTGWTVFGGTFAKNTTAGQFRTGTAALSVTRTSGTVGVSQDMSVIYPPVEFWQNRVVTCGAWVRATVASTTFISVSDGVSSPISTRHSGGGSYEFLTVSMSFSNVATWAKVFLFVDTTNTTSQFDSVICVLGSSVSNWQPSGYLGRKAILTLNSGLTQVASNTTTYIGTSQASTTETTVETPIPFRCVARNLTGRVSIAPGGAQTDTFTLRKNEADTLLTFSIAAAAQQGSDTTREVDLAKGDRLATKIVTSATALATQAVTTLECEEIPSGI